MRRLNLFSLPLLVLAIASFHPSAVAQDAAQEAPRATESPSIEDVITILEREEPPLGSRGDLCAISPGLLGETDVIWSDRPTFAWRGETGQITLRLRNSETPLWQQTFASDTQSITYAGAPLTPGQVYEWELEALSGMGPQYTFEVMAGADRDRIARDLQALENRLKAAGESTEAIALARARYFAEQRLWSDAFQALQSISNPTPDITEGMTQMTNYLCGTEE
ncbi:DUF928 domain-containing protein [Oscillatoria sp. FACHB-1407]|uniref:DUF928 domain-containing protein n=1 Tax=Oscillatoria sp. FACHB-1407 TaxID=2692847 RepID=UPI00168639B1|nr:DUF928 domain-containing protein [Oscillatoria sp. FACHB-1407]MBD2464379.1 DUF928 domain-containing protein [Oscillatoria sp. FACHB-1407]